MSWSTQVNLHKVKPGADKYVLSFDVGIRNLAWAFFRVSSDRLERSDRLELLDWVVVDIMTHCGVTARTSKNVPISKLLQCTSVVLFDKVWVKWIRNLMQTLTLGLDLLVVVERQMGQKANRIGSVSHGIDQFFHTAFLFETSDESVPVKYRFHYVSAKEKLILCTAMGVDPTVPQPRESSLKRKTADGSAPSLTKKQMEGLAYRNNKRRAKDGVELLSREGYRHKLSGTGASLTHSPWMNSFLPLCENYYAPSKKKDDYADSLLQGLWALEHYIKVKRATWWKGTAALAQPAEPPAKRRKTAVVIELAVIIEPAVVIDPILEDPSMEIIDCTGDYVPEDEVPKDEVSEDEVSEDEVPENEVERQSSSDSDLNYITGYCSAIL
jgi:hypothetical protein